MAVVKLFYGSDKYLESYIYVCDQKMLNNRFCRLEHVIFFLDDGIRKNDSKLKRSQNSIFAHNACYRALELYNALNKTKKSASSGAFVVLIIIKR